MMPELPGVTFVEEKEIDYGGAIPFLKALKSIGASMPRPGYKPVSPGDLRRALGRYNGSLGRRKYPNKVIDKLSGKWFQA